MIPFNLVSFLSCVTLVLGGVANPSADNHLEARGTCTGWSYQTQMLNSFNVHRTNHSAPNLVWNANLAAAALNTAKTGAIGTHDNSGTGWGQTLYSAWSSNSKDSSLQGSAAVDWWYNGEFSNYNFYGKDLTNFPTDWAPPARPGTQFYHFTQTVWKSTTSVGCATAPRSQVGTNGVYTVCNFLPQGNYITSKTTWKDNVLAPRGNPVVKILCPSGGA